MTRPTEKQLAEALATLADEMDCEEVCGHDFATKLRALVSAYRSAHQAEAGAVEGPVALSFAVFDEFGKPADDRVQARLHVAFDLGRQQGMDQARGEIDAAQTSAYAEGRQDQAEDKPACPHCGGAGDYEVPSNNGPDPEMIPIDCEHCGGTGCLNDAYRGVCALLAVEQGKYQKAIGELWAIKNKLTFPVVTDPLPANAIRRIKRECDDKGLDFVAFAWAVQKESHRVNFAQPAASSAQEPDPHTSAVEDFRQAQLAAAPARLAGAAQGEADEVKSLRDRIIEGELVLDGTHPPTLLFLMAEHWKAVATEYRAKAKDYDRLAHELRLSRVHPQAQVERKPLDGWWIRELWVEHGSEGDDAEGFARAIELAHGIRPTASTASEGDAA